MKIRKGLLAGVLFLLSSVPYTYSVAHDYVETTRILMATSPKICDVISATSDAITLSWCSTTDTGPWENPWLEHEVHAEAKTSCPSSEDNPDSTKIVSCQTTVKGLCKGMNYTFKVKKDEDTKLQCYYSTCGEVPLPPIDLAAVTTEACFTSLSLVWKIPKCVRAGDTFFEVEAHPHGQEDSNFETQHVSLEYHWYNNGRYTFTGLEPGETYDIKVFTCSEKANICSEAAEVPNYGTLRAAPSKPQELTVTQLTRTSLKLKWEKPLKLNGPLQGYNVNVKSNDGETVYEDDIENTITSKVVYKLKPCKEYIFSVSAFNMQYGGLERLEGDPTTTTFRTKSRVPLPPIDLTAVTTEAGITSLALAWKIPQCVREGDTFFQVEAHPHGKGDNNFETQSLWLEDHRHNNGQYTFTGLEPGETYDIKVFTCSEEANICSKAAEEPNYGTLRAAPSKPQDLKVAQLTSTTLEIKWDKPLKLNGPLHGYNIIVKSKDGETVYEGDIENTITSKEVDKIEPCKVYDISVSAFNEQYGDLERLEGDSTTTTIRTTFPVPLPPIDLTAVTTEAGTTSLALAWEIPKCVRKWDTFFQVEAHPQGKEDNNFATQHVSLEDHRHNNGRYTFTGLEPGETYDIKVFTCSIEGNICSKAAEEPNYGTLRAAPSKPQDLEVAQVTSTTLEIKWGKPLKLNGPLHGYNINVKSKDGEAVYDADIENTITSRVVDKLEPCKEYIISVSAFNAQYSDLERLEGDPTTITVRTKSPAPSKPVLKENGNYITSNSIYMKWREPGKSTCPPDGFIVHVTALERDIVRSVKTKETALTIEGLDPNTLYAFEVQAYNVDTSNGNSTQESEKARKFFWTLADMSMLPPTVELLSSKARSTSLTVKWRVAVCVSEGDTSYQVETYATGQRKKPLKKGEVSLKDHRKNRMEYVITGLEPGLVYDIKVFTNCRNGNNRSAPAELLNYGTLYNAPSQPQQLEAVKVTSTTLELRWKKPQKPNGPLDGYTILVQSKDGNDAQQDETKNTFFAVDGLSPNSEYEIYVRAFNIQRIGKGRLEGRIATIIVRTEIPRKPPSPARFTTKH